METLLVVPVFTIAVALFAVLILLHFVPMGLWISALAADVSISLFNLVGMRFRRVEPRMIVIPLIKGTKAGLGLNVNQLEAHYLAGGNVDNVVDALIAAHRAQIDLTFEQAAAIDLALVKELLLPWVLRKNIRMFLKILTIFPERFLVKVLIRVPLLKFFPLILLMWMWGGT